MKIVVLAGGLSTERDVSIITSTQVCKALRAKGHDALLLDAFFGYGEPGDDLTHVFEKDNLLRDPSDAIKTTDPDLEQIKAMRGGNPNVFFGPNVLTICGMADIVYMGLHGADGENGKVQAALDLSGIRYTGSGCIGSANAMDKGMAKKIFQATGIPTPKGFTVTPDHRKGVPSEIGFPCVVKPCCGGSSVGVSIPNTPEEYEEALDLAFRYEDEILVEEYIKGREFSVGVIASKSYPIIEIIPKTGFYDYANKYQAGMVDDVCPAELSDEITSAMQAWAVKVFQELKLDVYGRIDFLMDAKGDLYCLEANTLPGMTPTSLLPQEALAAGIAYGDLCEMMIHETIKKYEKKRDEVMKGMSLQAIAAVTGGTYTGPEHKKEQEVTAITIDSRNVTVGGVFVAIKGQRVDGNRFVEGSYEKGAVCCISTEPPKDSVKPYIQVASCEQALKDMAEYYRKECGIRVVGITGSVGKTTTKEMIASVLSEKYQTLKTLGNFNNEIGLPLTVFRIRAEHEVAVLEMGISDFGEMSRLARIARPDACVITNIGQCHLENLGTRDGILQAKTEVFDYLNPDAKVFLNGDDDKLATLTEDTRIQKPVYFGLDSNREYRAEQVNSRGLAGTEILLVTPVGSIQVRVPVPGRHMVVNALAAAAVGVSMGLDLTQIKAGIEKFQTMGGHGHIFQTDLLTVMDDCYNANPVSMRAGIDVLSEVPNQTVAILGDMFELGKDEEQMHYEVGKYAAEKRIKLLICIGDLAKQYVRGAYDAASDTEVLYFETRDQAMEELEQIIQPGDSILVKASHGMHFEKIVAKLKKM